MREHWKTGRWWMSRRWSNASNWQRFLDQRPQPTPPSASRHFRRVNFNNSTPHDPPSYRDDSHDFSGSFQLSEDPHSHEWTSERTLLRDISIARRSLCLLHSLFSLLFWAIVALAGVGTRTGSGRNEKLQVVERERALSSPAIMTLTSWTFFGKMSEPPLVG